MDKKKFFSANETNTVKECFVYFNLEYGTRITVISLNQNIYI